MDKLNRAAVAYIVAALFIASIAALTPVAIVVAQNNATGTNTTTTAGAQNNATGTNATTTAGAQNNATGTNTTTTAGAQNNATGTNATVLIPQQQQEPRTMPHKRKDLPHSFLQTSPEI